jgi:hypothetical protein
MAFVEIGDKSLQISAFRIGESQGQLEHSFSFQSLVYNSQVSRF